MSLAKSNLANPMSIVAMYAIFPLITIVLLSSLAKNSDRSLFFSTILTLAASKLSSRFLARLKPILPPPTIKILKNGIKQNVPKMQIVRDFVLCF